MSRGDQIDIPRHSIPIGLIGHVDADVSCLDRASVRGYAAANVDHRPARGGKPTNDFPNERDR
jgi:hypothetical protein